MRTTPSRLKEAGGRPGQSTTSAPLTKQAFMLGRSARSILAVVALNCTSLQAMADSPSLTPLSADKSRSAEQILDYYPPDAKAAGTSGSAVIKCGRTQHGGFEHCKALSEFPENSGFAAAALAITAHAAQGCLTLTEQQRAPKAWTFSFTTSPLSITPDVIKPGWMIQGTPWQRTPSYDELQRAYPKGALGAGRAVMVCKADDEGALVDCRISEEAPTGHGFGAAALKLANTFAVKTRSCEGRPTAGSTVIVPIHWNAPG